MGPGTGGGSWGEAEEIRGVGPERGGVWATEEEPKEFKKLGKGTNPRRWEVGQGGGWARALRGRGSDLRGEVCRPKLQLGPLGNRTSPLTVSPGATGLTELTGVGRSAGKGDKHGSALGQT